MSRTDALLQLAGAKRYREGTVILHANREAESMYVLLSGSASAFQNYQEAGLQQIATYNPISFFGEMSLFLNQPPTASVVALTDVIVLQITRENANEVFAKQPEIAFAIMEYLTKKLYMTIHPELVNQPKERKAKPNRTQPPSKPQKAVSVAATNQPSANSHLFPEGHGQYVLPLDNDKDVYLYEQSITCPLCGSAFPSMTVFSSRLRLEGTHDDLRVEYQDIEPMYYDVITCPQCLYSALSEQFENLDKRSAEKLNSVLQPYRSSIRIQSGKARDTFTVLAGYYLAILCAPHFLEEAEFTTAKLYRRLSWLYEDCGDSTMADFAAEKALQDYQYSYQHYDYPDKALQQICYIIGDLFDRMGNIEQAADFFYRAKFNEGGTRIMERKISDRIERLRRQQREKL